MLRIIGQAEAERPTGVYTVVPFEALRVGVRDGLGRSSDLEVIGEAASLERMLENNRFLDADVLVVDAEVFETTDSRLYLHLAPHLPSLRVLLMGSYDEAARVSDRTLRALLNLHTVGFVYKSGTLDRMAHAARLVADGVFVCESEVMRRLLEALAARQSDWKGPDPSDILSEREVEVVRLVAQGMANKEIARALLLSEGTVKAHVSHIMSKLGLSRRTELVRWAMERRPRAS
jgi:two-component system, NarL family, response regulator DevR